MAYIDGTYLDGLLDAATVTALCATTTARDAMIAAADAMVQAELYGVGYRTGTDPAALTPATTPEIIKQASFGAWLELAHLRNRKELPDAAKAWTGIRAQIRGGLEVAGLVRDASRAIGGVSAPDVSSARSDGGRPPVFDGDGMDGWF